ncbi:UNVERIFIED_CONTAM: hypothetical protein Slati_3517700 [Sesamum latifolium]|uniref:DUF4218 domain-containing protein n=1 Tax=Sesamum latifolium TaxID=2727402 RepID=A0AAW2UJA0_9LAMI
MIATSFMQKLIPIAFREMLLESVWSALTEVNLLFQIICLTTLDVVKVQELKDKVAIILCNLEKIFPPTFFDSMEHLIVHLPYETRVGGPVQYRWMYPFERPSRNDDLSMNDVTRIQQSIFNFLGRGSGASKKRWLSGSERHIIKTYILANCEVVTPYYESFLNELYEHYDSEDPIIEELVKDEINDMDNELLKLHYWGPTAEVTTFPCYFVNDYNFHTECHNVGKSTFNCGVCIKSSSCTDTDNDFYGILKKVIQLDYPLIPNMQIVLFKCRWVDPVRGVKVHPRYHLVNVNFKKVYQKNEPFLLAQQAVQVYYTEYPSMKRDKVDWMAVCKIKARRVVDDSHWTEVAFQEDESIPYSTSSDRRS